MSTTLSFFPIDKEELPSDSWASQSCTDHLLRGLSGNLAFYTPMGTMGLKTCELYSPARSSSGGSSWQRQVPEASDGGGPGRRAGFSVFRLCTRRGQLPTSQWMVVVVPCSGSPHFPLHSSSPRRGWGPPVATDLWVLCTEFICWSSYVSYLETGHLRR